MCATVLSIASLTVGCLSETAGKLAAIIDVEKMKRGRERVKL